MNTLDKQKQVLGEALNEDPKNIIATNPRWTRYLQEGILVQLHIGRWRAKVSLDYNDLGIKLNGDDKDAQEVISLGNKWLLPKEIIKRLDAIEQNARKCLRKNSYATYWGAFVPATTYGQLKEEMMGYKAQYFAARNELLENFDNYVSNVIRSHRINYTAAYNRLQLSDPGDTDYDAYIDEHLNLIKRLIPSREEVRRSFHFETDLHYIPLPSLLAEDAAEAERTALQVKKERLQAGAEEAKIEAEVQSARDAASYKAEMMREMHRDIVEQAQRQKEELVDGFLKDIVVQLRSMVYNATLDVLKSIEKNDRLHPRSVVQLKKLVEQVGNLNFYGDQDIEQMVREIDQKLSIPAEDRSLGEITENLQDIATVVKASLIGLGHKPRQERGLGVSDNPTPVEVTRARRGLDLVSEPEVMALERKARGL